MQNSCRALEPGILMIPSNTLSKVCSQTD
jgi:hypothetical protein